MKSRISWTALSLIAVFLALPVIAGAQATPKPKITAKPGALKHAKAMQNSAQAKSMTKHPQGMTGNSASGEAPNNPGATPLPVPKTR